MMAPGVMMAVRNGDDYCGGREGREQTVGRKEGRTVGDDGEACEGDSCRWEK